MSFDALAWAAKQRTGSSGTKLVLLGLAECADRSTNRAFPSIAALVEFSDLNRKSVIANLDRLEAAGFIRATGEKVGRTAQVKVYELLLQAVPKTEQFQKRNGSEITPKQSQKRDTEPVREPLPPVATQQSESAREVSPKDLIPEVVEAWQQTAERYGLPQLRGTLNPDRRKKLLARLREHPIEDWQDAFAAIGRSKFLRGETGNWRGADFDFLLSPKTFQRTIEGRYDDSSH